MAFLDPHIADYHKPNADHLGVILEIPYSVLTTLLENERLGVMSTLEQAIDSALVEKNQQRAVEGKGTLQNYYRDFALLQEITKAAFSMICGDLTVAHTSAEISPFSVTSFCEVGVALELVDAEQIMAYDG